jgi:hypothetical protein
MFAISGKPPVARVLVDRYRKALYLSTRWRRGMQGFSQVCAAPADK